MEVVYCKEFEDYFHVPFYNTNNKGDLITDLEKFVASTLNVGRTIKFYTVECWENF